jgi:hypothetical protein
MCVQFVFVFLNGASFLPWNFFRALWIQGIPLHLAGDFDSDRSPVMSAHIGFLDALMGAVRTAHSHRQDSEEVDEATNASPFQSSSPNTSAREPDETRQRAAKRPINSDLISVNEHAEKCNQVCNNISIQLCCSNISILYFDIFIGIWMDLLLNLSYHDIVSSPHCAQRNLRRSSLTIYLACSRPIFPHRWLYIERDSNRRLAPALALHCEKARVVPTPPPQVSGRCCPRAACCRFRPHRQSTRFERRGWLALALAAKHQGALWQQWVRWASISAIDCCREHWTSGAWEELCTGR